MRHGLAFLRRAVLAVLVVIIGLVFAPSANGNYLGTLE